MCGRAILRKMLYKFRTAWLIVWLTLLLPGFASGQNFQLRFRVLDKSVIEARIEDFSRNNNEREEMIRKLFAESGCAGTNLFEQPLKTKLPPNVICVLPGQTDEEIVVGAHTDHVEEGDGVVDNWSSAVFLPELYYSLAALPRRHTFVFVGFTGEERGMLGSEYYVHHLSKGQRAKIEGMVNMDSIGLGPTKVWASHADKIMFSALIASSKAMSLPIGVVNVDQVGTTDSESFAEFRIPRITIHSVTQQTWAILHSSRDNLSVIKMDDYYATYQLMAGYLVYLDKELGRTAEHTEKPTAAVPLQ